MKAFSLIISSLFFAITTSAQVRWNPQWKDGNTQTIEYIYSKVERESDTLKKFDSVNATIQAKYVGKVGDDHFLQWTYTKYYVDTMRGSASDRSKLTYSIAAQALLRCPVKFLIKGSDMSVSILNMDQIDSVAKLAMDDLIKKSPKQKTDEDRELLKGMMQLMYELQKDKLLYGQINNFYSIYGKGNLKPNVKMDAKDEAKDKASKKLMNDSGMEGYSLLDDTDPKQYKYTIDRKMDMSGIVKLFADIAKSLSDSTDGKGSKSKKKAKEKETPMDIPKNMGGISSLTEIIVTKPDMLVSSYYVYGKTDGAMLGTDMSETEMERIRIVK